MKKITKIILIVLGILIYAIGCVLGGNGLAMIIGLFGATIMMIGLSSFLDTLFTRKK